MTLENCQFIFDGEDKQRKHTEQERLEIEQYMTKIRGHARSIIRCVQCMEQFFLRCLAYLGVNVMRGWDKTIKAARIYHPIKLVAIASIAVELLHG